MERSKALRANLSVSTVAAIVVATKNGGFQNRSAVLKNAKLGTNTFLAGVTTKAFEINRPFIASICNLLIRAPILDDQQPACQKRCGASNRRCIDLRSVGGRQCISWNSTSRKHERDTTNAPQDVERPGNNFEKHV
jgi:hypothetical protein